MSPSDHSAKDRKIDELVNYFISSRQLFDQFEMSLENIILSTELRPYIHSVKKRIKDPAHLREKLSRKIKESDLAAWAKDNVFTKIGDLVGFRILHLHTSQVQHIVKILNEKLLEFDYQILEEATARPWDDEYRETFTKLGIAVEDVTPGTRSLYTSVHMTVQFSNTRYAVAGEIQIRTLAEELWGEVDHKINYPVPHADESCRDQLRVLARITSACTRSVDGIFNHLDYLQRMSDCESSK